MTNVITRYFGSAEQAQAVKDDLRYGKKFPSSALRMFVDKPGVVDDLSDADVADET